MGYFGLQEIEQDGCTVQFMVRMYKLSEESGDGRLKKVTGHFIFM